jgi:hypothetical protein
LRFPSAAEHIGVPPNMSNDWLGRCGERDRLDEAACLIEHTRAADARTCDRDLWLDGGVIEL